ncbi:hypothetical protein [Methylobacterium sp. WL116]|uniref:hypothetical protein n=1 Tax=Methylobacterium sp. WL116 TaxID=2603889 RepID=UPI0011C9904A|nr:hypothetical protein [Methylobacterium sp. WL116]TXM94945.1 hypothetical protein FV223_02725 [Methylobacterium sp. WL116]
MTKRYIIVALLALATPSPAPARSVLGDIVKGTTGGQIDIDKGEACILNQCINDKGKTRTKSVDELIGDALGTIPGYVLLSDADKNNAAKLAKSGGLILATTTMDPVTGGIIIQLLNGPDKQEVPVPTYAPNPPSTSISYTITAVCIASRGPKNFTAAFGDPPADLNKVKRGDTVNLTAPICAGMAGSVSSVVMVATSEATPVQNNPSYKWLLLGETK